MYVCMYACMYVMHVCMYACMYVCMHVCLAGFSKRLSIVISPVSRVPPSLNFPVTSSYKNRNCLNIRTSLDILDNRQKVAASLCAI